MSKAKIDDLDIKILEKLDENIRAGNKEIADALGVQRQIVDYRIKRMETNGTIIGYRMLGNTTKLGYQYRRVHIKLRSVTTGEKQQILKKLVQHERTVWLVECDGVYDILWGGIAKSIEEFQKVLFEFLSSYNNAIYSYEIVQFIEMTVPSRDFSGTRHERTIKGSIAGTFEPEKITAIDKKIINELAKNGRLSALKIAKNVGERPEVVNYHIKQIMKKGILFSNIQFGYNVFGFELYKTLIYLKNPVRKRIEEFKKFARSYPRVWDIIESSGKWQIELDIESKGHADYYEIMDAIQNRFSDIILYYDTLYIRKEWKFLFSVF